MKRIAVSRLHLPDGTILRNQVVEVLPHTDGQLPLVGGGWVDCGPVPHAFTRLPKSWLAQNGLAAISIGICCQQNFQFKANRSIRLTGKWLFARVRLKSHICIRLKHITCFFSQPSTSI